MNMILSTSTRIAPIMDVSMCDVSFGCESIWNAGEELRYDGE